MASRLVSGRCGLVLALVSLAFTCWMATVTLVACQDAADPHTTPPNSLGRVFSTKHELTFLSSREALVEAVSCLYTPRPTLILFTPANSALGDAATAALRNVTEQELLPSGLLAAAHVFTMQSTNAVDMAVVDMLAPGQDTRQPFLALYCAAVDSAYGVPGLPVSPFPSFLPRYYGDSPLFRQQMAALRQASSKGRSTQTPSPLTHGPSMRQWVLSEAPVRYADPVTLAMMPAVHSVFSVAELHALLRGQVMRWGIGHEGGLAGVRASQQPVAVVAAHVHLTTTGSVEVVATLNAVAARFGGAVLVLATERPDVAKLLGLTEFNTARVVVAPCSPSQSPQSPGLAGLLAAVKGQGDNSDEGDEPTESTAEASGDALAAAGPVVSIDTCTAAGAFMQRLVTDHLSCIADEGVLPVTAEQRRALESWRADLQRFMSTSPLRKLTTDEELSWAFRTQSAKILFFLRESDEKSFAMHFKLAVEVASRVRRQWIRLKTKSGAAKAFHPAYCLDVYWIDAELHPVVASQLHQNTVPSVVIAFPVLSKEEEAQRAEEAKRSGGSAAPMLNAEALHGFHTVNVHDLHVLDEMTGRANAGTVGPSPPALKSDLEPLFPSDADEFLRFVVGDHFLERVQVAMVPFEAARLFMGDAADAKGDTAAAPNKAFLQLDHRYWASSTAEVAPLTYLRDAVTGVLQLPPYVAGADPSVHGANGADPAEQAKAASAKAKWKAELERRQREREERIRAKAAKAAEQRDQVKEEIKNEVIRELREQQGSAGADGPAGTAMGKHAVGSGVPRPPANTKGDAKSVKAALARRRKKALADATAWKDESVRMVRDYVVLGKNRTATIIHGLEAPPTSL